MNVYDFDKTIFYPDSSATFILWMLRRYPRLVLPSVLGDIPVGLGYFLGIVSTDALKEQLFSFLPRIADIDGDVADFWADNLSRLLQWYPRRQKADDVIVSAGPEFLHIPVAAKMGFRLIGTRLDKHTGKLTGHNCHGEEKVRRFRELFPDAVIDEFYSDSLIDLPLAREAKKAFRVKKGRLSYWHV